MSGIYGSSQEDRYYERLCDEHTEKVYGESIYMDYRCVICGSALREGEEELCSSCIQLSSAIDVNKIINGAHDG